MLLSRELPRDQKKLKEKIGRKNWKKKLEQEIEEWSGGSIRLICLLVWHTITIIVECIIRKRNVLQMWYKERERRNHLLTTILYIRIALQKLNVLSSSSARKSHKKYGEHKWRKKRQTKKKIWHWYDRYFINSVILDDLKMETSFFESEVKSTF